MKKLLVACFAIVLTTGVFAQDSTGTSNMAPSKADHSGVMMKNGKVMVMKDGKVSTLSDKLTLANGTVVMADGSVKMSDGTNVTMQDGDYFKMDGTKGNMKMKMDNADKMKADSTK